MIDNEEVDDFLHAALGGMEQRADLERIRAMGVRVEVDLDDERSSLSQYVAHVREAAIAALDALARCDASNALAITRHQSVVRQYLDVRDWARAVIEASVSADEGLRQTDGDD